MHFNWNNTFSRVLASSVVALSAATSLYAIPKGPCDPKPQDVCCTEPKPGPFAFAYPMDMNLACPRDFYVHVDGLAFQAKQDGMEFAIQDSNSAGTNSISRGVVEGFSTDNRDWDYNPGIRFGIGFYLDHDAWQLDFNWTWVNITNYRLVSGGTSGGIVIPQWLTGNGTSGTPAQLISSERCGAKWDSSYNVFDIRLSKPYHVSRYLVFNPFFGVRAGWIDQHFSVSYSGNAAGFRTISHTDNDFWGIGTRAGLDTDWFLGKGWSLFGNLSLSMLFGKFEIDQHLTYPAATGSTDGYDIDFDYYQNTPNIELALGIAWGKYFDKMKYHIGLKAAYEFIEWFDQLNIRKFFSGSDAYANDVVSRGNFTLNGFSLRVQLDI